MRKLAPNDFNGLFLMKTPNPDFLRDHQSWYFFISRLGVIERWMFDVDLFLKFP